LNGGYYNISALFSSPFHGSGRCALRGTDYLKELGEGVTVGNVVEVEVVYQTVGVFGPGRAAEQQLHCS
ncbi:hypothetical protein, partial [Pectobacterium odoriferum]|uniref:hypothetical protein n=1 Tax=Pectobacterium odoriferum TaxID=78398 RepID=UPI001CF11E07